jgi:GT2 family glycosyltransferase
MKISIIVPSFNQGAFLEETLQSIFAQDGVETEVMVFDGGSTDQTLDVLRRYDKRLAYWESKPDRGQTHAINKGLTRMTGDVWMFLNSDDLMVPGALAKVSGYFADPSVHWVGGSCENFDQSGTRGGVTAGPVSRPKDYLTSWNRPSQHVFPFSGACYMRREVVDRIGTFDESYHYALDSEYYCRAVLEGGFSPTVIPDVLARWRWHPEAKTMLRGIAYGFRADEVRYAQKYAYLLPPDQRSELEAEVRVQLKWLPLREATWLLGNGQKRKALNVIVGAAWAYPSLLMSRPWLGALRRALVAFAGIHPFT